MCAALSALPEFWIREVETFDTQTNTFLIDAAQAQLYAHVSANLSLGLPHKVYL